MKSEVATRKETELHFERVIEQRVQDITEKFTVTYLNQLYEMRNKVKEFGERQERMQEQRLRVQTHIDSELNSQKEFLIKRIQE